MKIFFNSPLFFPPLDFFSALAHSDLWVVLDHLQFRSRTLENQFKTKTSTGEVHILRVPITYPTCKPFHQITVNNFLPWKRQLTRNFESDYGETNFFNSYIDSLKYCIQGPCVMLETLNLNIIFWISGLLGISVPYVFSRNFCNNKSKAKTIKHLCSRYSAEPFNAKFESTNNREKNLSILDYIFNLGAEGSRKLIDSQKLLIH